jgi:hypothetical protein
VFEAVQPHLGSTRLPTIGSVLLQYFGFLYPYWLLEYRRVQSWRYAAGVARAMRPAATLSGCGLSAPDRLLAGSVYGVATVAGLAAPVGLLRMLHRPARRVARFVGDRAVSISRS